MRQKSTSRTFSWGSAFLGLAALGLSAGTAQAQTVYGLSITTSNRAIASLVTFNATAPSTITATVPITGVAADQIITGIDCRPNTGELFALGYNASTQTGRLYVINPTTGLATGVGAGSIAMPLGGIAGGIGFDFNPTVDRIRVVSRSNQANLRLNPVTGGLAATDSNLAYATTDPNAGQTPGVGAVAYTNSYIGATGTTLYDIDEAAKRLLIQSPPNNGSLNTVGPIAIPTQPPTLDLDLDIYFDSSNGTNTAFLSQVVDGPAPSVVTAIYSVNLATGATTQLGSIGTLLDVPDIAVQINRPTSLPTITGQLVYALGGTNLITFDSANPSLIRAAIGITGVDATQTLVGLDIRPATNSLYALGYNATTQTATVYTINAATGAARAINATPVALALGTGSIGFDFNPTVDRIRVVGANRANFRLNPNDGAIAATDGQLTYATGDVNAANTPSIGAVAYTNSVAGATATQLFDYDETRNVLALQSPPNDGTLNTVGTTGLTATVARDVDMDIFSTGTANTAYLVANSAANGNSTFYTLNTTTGATTAQAIIGNGSAIRDIAVAGAAGVTGVRRAELATNLALYPNPVRGLASISFGLPRAARVTMIVTDALGRTIDTVDAGLRPAGTQLVQWESKGRTAGTYFLSLRFDNQPAGTRQVIVTE